MKRAAETVAGASLEESSTMSFIPLGSGREVGRSCHVLKFKEKTIMFDCGIHPGRKGVDALPYFDAVDPTEIDLLLVTHFHLDHMASLPYFTEKTNFKGRIFMTHPTKAVAMMLLLDYVRVGGAAEDLLYDDNDVKACLERCELVDFHQELVIDGIKFTAYNAGHVLGACMFVVEIAGVRVLYTGDYSREDDRHLMGAEIPAVHPDVLVVESTYGVQVHESREKREERFKQAIEKIVMGGGKCLIPVFSLGRAQELLLILEEFWESNPSLQGIPIYHASKLASKSLKVYQTYINVMNERIRKQLSVSNPWLFNHISNLSSTNEFDELGPAVVMASPGMLQNGPSRQLFERWCTDPINGTILAGYAVEGTLAKHIMDAGVTEITTLDGRIIPLNCQIKYISFTAHSDFVGTRTFIEQLSPRHVVLVHGEAEQMSRLQTELRRKFAEKDITADQMSFINPINGQVVEMKFQEERIVQAIGVLSEQNKRSKGSLMAGLLLQKDFVQQFVAAEDLATFTQLSTTVVKQQLHLPFHSNFERLKLCIGKLFETKDLQTKTPERRSKSKVITNCLSVFEEIEVTHTFPPGRVLLAWKASPSTDMIVDAIISLLMQSEGGIAGIRISSCCGSKHRPDKHFHQHEAEAETEAEGKAPVEDKMETDEQEQAFDFDTPLAKLVLKLLTARFGAGNVDQQAGTDGTVLLRSGDAVVATVIIKYCEVVSEDKTLAKQLDNILKRAEHAICPVQSIKAA